jgi:hypothetical protein
MTSIIVTNPIKFDQQPTQSRMIPDSEKRMPQTYEAALLELGRILTKEDSFTPWMSIRKISGQCHKHWAKLPRIDYSIRPLTYWAIDWLRECGELRGEDMKVEFRTEHKEDRKNEEFFLQFRKIYPDGSCA